MNFEVKCADTRPGEHVRVVGSTRELGCWDPSSSSVILRTSAESFPFWRSERLNLFTGAAPQEYKYVIVTSRGYHWEGRPNRQLRSSSDVISDVFNLDNPELPLDEVSYNYVTFQVEIADIGFGQHLRVVGSLDELGAWSPSSTTVQMTAARGSPGVWSSTRIPLRSTQLNFEYKYVLCSDDLAQLAPRWEGRSNRLIMKNQFEKLHLLVHDKFDSFEVGCSFTKHVATISEQPDIEIPVGGRVAQVANETQAEEELAVKPERSPKRNATITTTVRRRSSVIVRAKTMASPNELPDGFLATRRSLDEPKGASGFAREASCHQLQALELAPRPAERTASKSGSLAVISGAARMRVRVLTQKLKGSVESDSQGSDDEESERESTVGSATELQSASPASFDDLYLLGEQLGEGAFGIVHKCTSKVSGEELASKVILKSRLKPFEHAMIFGDEATGKEGELALHHSLPQHPCIVTMHAHFEDADGVNMILDLCSGGDLFDAIVRAYEIQQDKGGEHALSESEARHVIKQVFDALAFCHAHAVVHRDVKAENVLLTGPLAKTDGAVRLCDFGLAARCSWEDGDVLKEQVGSPDYAAPEVVRHLPYAHKVDVWSSGVLLFVCLVCQSPFAAETDTAVMRKIARGSFEFGTEWNGFSSEVRSLITRCLEVDSKRRPSAEESLSDQFFKLGSNSK